VVPAAVFRTFTVVVLAILALFLEMAFGVALIMLFNVPLYLWTLLLFTLIWIAALVDLWVFQLSNIYILRRDGLEVKRGIIRLHSFVVTPSGFGDLMLYQGLGGRIFGYGDLTVNSQGGRQTRLSLVRDPYRAAEVIRGVMWRSALRLEER
jgi:hypothetical protein